MRLVGWVVTQKKTAKKWLGRYIVAGKGKGDIIACYARIISYSVEDGHVISIDGLGTIKFASDWVTVGGETEITETLIKEMMI